jgi:hypothetical protein
MATTPVTPPVGSSAQQTLSEWAGPYVTEMLGKTQAVANQPYSVYQGPMTAGESNLQSNVFKGLGELKPATLNLRPIPAAGIISVTFFMKVPYLRANLET